MTCKHIQPHQEARPDQLNKPVARLSIEEATEVDRWVPAPLLWKKKKQKKKSLEWVTLIIDPGVKRWASSPSGCRRMPNKVRARFAESRCRIHKQSYLGRKDRCERERMRGMGDLKFSNFMEWTRSGCRSIMAFRYRRFIATGSRYFARVRDNWCRSHWDVAFYWNAGKISHNHNQAWLL